MQHIDTENNNFQKNKETILQNIENLIFLIKQKGKNNNFSSADNIVILTFEMLILEISNFDSISIDTIKALNQIHAMLSFIHYKNDFLDIYDKISEIYYSLSFFSDKINNADVGIIGHQNKDFIKYFNKALKNLIENSLNW